MRNSGAWASWVQILQTKQAPDVAACTYPSPQRTQRKNREEWLPHETLDAVKHVHDVEVQQETYTHATQLQIGQQLSVMDRQDGFHRLNLHEHDPFDSHVDSECGINLESVVEDRQSKFGLNFQPCLLNGMRETAMVRFLPFLCGEGQMSTDGACR